MPFAATSLSFTRGSWWTLNGIWSFLRPYFQASRFPLKRNVSGTCKVTLLPWTGLRPVSFNKRQQNEEAFFSEPFMVHACFPAWNIVFSVSFCFKVANYAYATRRGILTKIRACEHSSNFCEQFEQRPNFASTFKLDGTIRYPLWGKMAIFLCITNISWITAVEIFSIYMKLIQLQWNNYSSFVLLA